MKSALPDKNKREQYVSHYKDNPYMFDKTTLKNGYENVQTNVSEPGPEQMNKTIPENVNEKKKDGPRKPWATHAHRCFFCLLFPD